MVGYRVIDIFTKNGNSERCGKKKYSQAFESEWLLLSDLIALKDAQQEREQRQK